MKNSCPYKIADESEIGNIIVSREMIRKDVWYVKVHLIKSKINPNNLRPDVDYLFAIITCNGNTGLPISSLLNVPLIWKR